MLPRTRERSPGRLLFVGAVLVGACATLAGQPARAADVMTDSSLALIPADAAFYAANLRNKEQLDILLKSKAFKKLMALPAVKMGLQQFHAQAGMGIDPNLQKFLQSEEGKEAIHLVLDALSHDTFIYGGKSWVDALALMGQVNNAQQFAPLTAMLNGQDPNKAQMRAILGALQKNKETIQVPDLVFGFKVSDKKKAEEKLKNLHAHLIGAADQVPQLKGKVKSVKVGADTFLSLSVDGSLIPWDDVPLKDFEEKKDEFEDLVKQLKKTTLSVSVGFKGDFFLLAIGSSVKNLDKLGSGKTLAQRAEFKPLAKYADKKVVDIGYVSKALQGGVSGGRDLSAMGNQLKELLGKADLKPERRKAIEKDLDQLFQDMKMEQPNVGAAVSFSFLNDKGIEGYSYNYGDFERLKDLQFKLHDHMGGNPIFAAGFALAVDGKGYDALVKWVKTIHGHAEAVFLDKAEDDAKDMYKKVIKEFLPLIKRLDQATSQLLIPSLKGGSMGLVLDAKWTSKQWHKMMPPPKQPMPMLELGFILGISDPAKFQKAMKEYRTTLNELYAKGREASPDKDNVPEFKIPAPETEKGKGGTLYYHPIPEEFGLDKQFRPTAGVGKNVAVLTLSKQHTERLLARKPLAIKGGPLAAKHNLVAGCYLNWPALIDTVTPWVEYSASTYAAAGEDKDGGKKAEEILKQVRVGLSVLKAFKGSTSATYVLGKTLVTHSQATFEDIDD